MKALEEGRLEAYRRAVIQRRFADLGAVGAFDASVYVLENCFCVGQGGYEQQFHVHVFTPDGFEGWCKEYREIIVREKIDL